MSKEKRHDPTPERLRQAREKGDVPRSRVLAALGALATGGWVLFEADLHGWRDLSRRTLSLQDPLPLVAATWWSFGWRWTAWAATAAALGAFFGSLAVGGWVWAPKVFRIGFDRLDPVKGTKRLFEPKTWFDGLRDLGWMAAVAFTCLMLARVPGLFARPRWALAALAGSVVVLGLPWALLDVLWTRRAHRRRHRMSLEEVKEEAKRSEGDPQTKQQRRQRGRQILQDSLRKRVESAAVVFVNPTHYAVALAHDPERPDPPWVVARGREAEALRMRSLARRGGVPVVRHVALARRLYRLQEEDEIPEELYGPVAQVLCRLLNAPGGE